MSNTPEFETLPRNDDGTLTHYAWPGGYEIAYYAADGERICYACAVEQLKLDAEGEYTAESLPKYAGIYWEGPTEFCAECNKECASEYGDPDNTDEDNA